MTVHACGVNPCADYVDMVCAFIMAEYEGIEALLSQRASADNEFLAAIDAHLDLLGLPGLAMLASFVDHLNREDTYVPPVPFIRLSQILNFA
jgi:hypothetical protein